MKIKMLLFILLTTITLSETNLVLGMFTNHFINNQMYNNNNHQIGIDHNNWYLQYMKNSYNDDTISISHNWYNDKGFFVGVGLAYGYEKVYYKEYEEQIYECGTAMPFITDNVSVMGYIGYECELTDKYSVNIVVADFVNMTFKIKIGGE